jgi:hypothetical protein
MLGDQLFYLFDLTQSFVKTYQSLVYDKKMLPKSITKKILIKRANDWLSHLCNRYFINESEFRSFLKNNDAVCFGSFVIACLLNTHDFDDIDIMIPNERLTNYQIRQSIQRITTTTEDTLILDQKSLYCPRYMCDHCANVNEDEQLFTYHRVHNISQELRFDIIETKNIRQHLTNSTFDTGIIHFDGVNFNFDGFDLISFVASPSFRIISITKGINFEFFYDPWASICNANAHSDAKYEFVEDSTFFKGFPKIESQVKSLKKIWKNELNCFSWFHYSSLFLPILDLMKLCFSHFRRDKMTNLTTFYKITRLTLRILKNVFRGIKLKNMNEFYLTN